MRIKFDAIDTGFKYTNINIRKTIFIRSTYIKEICKYSIRYLEDLFKFFSYLKEVKLYNFNDPLETKLIRHFLCNSDFPDANLIRIASVLEAIFYYILATYKSQTGTLVTIGLKQKIFAYHYTKEEFYFKGNSALTFMLVSDKDISLYSNILSKSNTFYSNEPYLRDIPMRSTYTQLVWS